MLGMVSQEMFASAGCPIIISPVACPHKIASLVDILVITGGYHLPMCLKTNEYIKDANKESEIRTKHELEMIGIFVREERPILGLCYGMQLLNLYFGGTLKESQNNHGEGLPGSEISKHRVTISNSKWMINGDHTVSTNHSMEVSEVGKGLKVIAKADDGTIEALENNHILAVQWHPEIDDTLEMIVNGFCKNSNTG